MALGTTLALGRVSSGIHRFVGGPVSYRLTTSLRTEVVSGGWVAVSVMAQPLDWARLCHVDMMIFYVILEIKIEYSLITEKDENSSVTGRNELI